MFLPLVFKDKMEGVGDALRLAFSFDRLILGIGCRRFNSPLDFFLRGVPLNRNAMFKILLKI